MLPPAPTGAHELHARMPENGGWSETTLYAAAGQPLRLRLTSDDVLHSFAIGRSDEPPIDLLPGEWTETSLVFDQPGRYTYYCTRWCGPNHWRMRGTIEVAAAEAAVAVSAGAETAAAESAGAESPAPQPKPLYLRLGLDVDAPHPAGAVPAASPSTEGAPSGKGAPSAERGAALAGQLGDRLPAWIFDRQTYLENSPSALWQRLRDLAALQDLSAAQVWDLVAYLAERQVSPAARAAAAQRYATNCAACHGETGQGDGVMVAGLPRFTPGETHTSPTTRPPDAGMPAMEEATAPASGPDMRLSAPPDFTDPRVLLGASPALLEGKMLRGGMGTGMPYWGPIFTEEQMDGLIAYLYSFAMKN